MFKRTHSTLMLEGQKLKISDYVKKTNSIAREHVLALSLAFYEPNPRTITFTSWFPWLWFLLSIPMYSRNSFLTQIFRMKNYSWKQEFTTKLKYIYVLNRPFWSLQLRQCRQKNFHLSFPFPFLCFPFAHRNAWTWKNVMAYSRKQRYGFHCAVDWTDMSI